MIKTDTEILEFVENKFNGEERLKLKRIHTGGINNHKGNNYESIVASIKITKLAAKYEPKEYDNIIISAQELSFVDDLCIFNNIDNIKLNYQIKNSISFGANWSSQHQKRFDMQTKIDQNLYGYESNKQVLIVSNKEIHYKNKDKLHDVGLNNYLSEYIPFTNDILELARTLPDFRKALNKISTNDNLSTIEYVFTMIKSVWENSRLDTQHYLSDLISKVKYQSKPDYVIDTIPSEHIPDWLIDIRKHIKGLQINIEKGIVLLNIGSFTVTLGKSPTKPAKLDKMLNEKPINSSDIISLLMTESFSDNKEQANG